MRIGELARLAGCTPKAVRLYEARGLLGVVARAGAYRNYGELDLARVQLIRQAQALGFRLAELDGLPRLHSDEGWANVAALVAARRAAVALEQQRLTQLQQRLGELQAELMDCALARAPAAALAQKCIPLLPPVRPLALRDAEPA